MDLRWPPNIVGRVRRPAHPGRRLAAVVVRAAAPGEAMRVPPMPQATTVRVPTTGRMHSLEEVLRAWLTTPGISTQCPTTGDQAEHECAPPRASHVVHSPLRFGRHRSPGASRPAMRGPLASPDQGAGREDAGNGSGNAGGPGAAGSAPGMPGIAAWVRCSALRWSSWRRSSQPPPRAR